MFSEPIRDFFARVERAESSTRTIAIGGDPIELNYTTGRAAGAYERLRNLIDYREEHAVRRNAIERILKRLVLIERQSDVGVTLIRELVEGGYLSAELATDVLARTVQDTVYRFLSVRQPSFSIESITKQLLSLAATEIESHLSPLQYAVDRESVEVMYKTLRTRMIVSGASVDRAHEQLYCACWRTLLAADDERLMYALWLLYMPEWGSSDQASSIDKVPHVLARIRTVARSSLQWQIVPKIHNLGVSFRIIRELVNKRGSAARAVFENERELEEQVRALLEERYKVERDRIRSSGVRAVVYLFVTKMIVALLVEVPYELLVLKHLSYVPLAVNIFFHPALLFSLTRNVRSLSERNTTSIIEGMRGVLYPGTNTARPITIGAGYSRFALAFGVVYAVLFCAVFGALIGFLQAIGFNTVSIGLFMLFFALVSYFAFRIRRQARRWYVTADHGLFATLGTLLVVPIVRAGAWLARTFSAFNVFILVMDFIIETPFKRILSFIHQFMLYMRERIDEMR